MSWFELEDERATLGQGRVLAEEFRQRLPKGGSVFLHGDLGAGKTTLARGIMRGLGYEGRVTSPTYTFVERYATMPFQCSHFDLYRLDDPEELEFIGARDAFEAGNLCLVEWPERAGNRMPNPDVDIYLRLNYLKNVSQTTKINRQIKIEWHNVEV